MIHRWFGGHPELNVGVATGAISGFVVLDIDPRHGGFASLAEMESEHGPMAFTPTVLTGGGGEHRYFMHPGRHVGSRNGLAPGLDLKADGGYVVVPPSVHSSGRRYEWKAGLALGQIGLAEVPSWLCSAPTTRPSRAMARDFATSSVIPAGQRNSRLTSIAGAMRRAGLAQPEISVALHEVNSRRCQPPLPQREVEAIASSIARYQPAPQTSALARRAHVLSRRLQ